MICQFRLMIQRNREKRSYRIVFRAELTDKLKTCTSTSVISHRRRLSCSLHWVCRPIFWPQLVNWCGEPPQIIRPQTVYLPGEELQISFDNPRNKGQRYPTPMDNPLKQKASIPGEFLLSYNSPFSKRISQAEQSSTFNINKKSLRSFLSEKTY